MIRSNRGFVRTHTDTDFVRHENVPSVGARSVRPAIGKVTDALPLDSCDRTIASRSVNPRCVKWVGTYRASFFHPVCPQFFYAAGPSLKWTQGAWLAATAGVVPKLKMDGRCAICSRGPPPVTPLLNSCLSSIILKGFHLRMSNMEFMRRSAPNLT